MGLNLLRFKEGDRVSIDVGPPGPLPVLSTATVICNCYDHLHVMIDHPIYWGKEHITNANRVLGLI